jgi:hypothetical protein
MAVNATKRVSWKSVKLGDYAYVVFDYQGNNEVRVIPRAKGVKIRSTADLGGGMLNITVTSLVAKNSRFALENYFGTLDSLLELNTEGSLEISDENGTLTLTNCYLESFTQSGEDLKVNTMVLKFIKSL